MMTVRKTTIAFVQRTKVKQPSVKPEIKEIKVILSLSKY